jgi:hypothetical protein
MTPQPHPAKFERSRKMDLMRAEYDRWHAERGSANPWRRQYVGEAADRVLARLRDAYAEGQVSIETLESVTEDIVFGRPTRLPFAVTLMARRGSYVC